MANRNFHRLQSLTREVKLLHAKVSIGASGAPTLIANDSVGIASIARNSAGLYTITLADKYSSLVDLSILQLAASAQDLTFQLTAESVSSAKTLQFVCKTATTATDPSSGSTLFIKIALKNTSVPR